LTTWGIPAVGIGFPSFVVTDAAYRPPRNPEESLLYQVVAGELETFLAAQRDHARQVPGFIEKEFRSFSIAACSPVASSGSLATPAGWTASWRSPARPEIICFTLPGHRRAAAETPNGKSARFCDSEKLVKFFRIWWTRGDSNPGLLVANGESLKLTKTRRYNQLPF